ncbi:ABC transporter permease [Deinococcus peraridilitoris]|uniref:ABC-type Na+ efflux pump, permease component n=1 Tax=Deinococcus peraridilitoris (strain DSM 19664 / LMG 22246 / CIP 109416 / KR-200) TaxID=937777 RepID=K9ZXT4_DEIPD|nr:ABC transporter permease [Deinococcus peraridilitoris]AFZ65717.1 ABC-type Na+ efflux pump, permease component [Deinococcus peraridilitoris DSM 19664]
MRGHFIWKVAYKELVSTLRDRRTLVSTIVMPLIFIPLFTIAFPLLLSRTFGGEQERRQTVGVVGLASLPEGLRERLTRSERAPDGSVLRSGVDLVDVREPLQAVQSGKAQAVLELPARLPGGAGEGQATVKLYSKSSDQRIQAGAAQKVRDALRDYNDTLVRAKLRELSFDETFLAPLRVEAVDAATTQERSGGPLGFIIPYFLLQFILAGAMATAIDSTAGEKERGTLEVLLVSPVRRSEVVVGKLLATTLFAMASAVFGVAGFALAGPLGRLVLPEQVAGEAFASALGGTLAVGAGELLILLAVAVSAALLISAILLSIAVFARSYKEAQTYLTPIAIVLIIPLFMLQFSDFLTKTPLLYAIPLVNGALVILDIIKGALLPANAVTAIVSNLVYTVLFTLLALRSFSREQVIFRN